MEAKTSFLGKLDTIRTLLMPAGAPRLNNYDLLSALFQLDEDQSSCSGVRDGVMTGLSLEAGSSSTGSIRAVTWSASFLESAGEMNNYIITVKPFHLAQGIYTGGENSGQQLFLVERKAFMDLCEGLTRWCTCTQHSVWGIESFQQV